MSAVKSTSNLALSSPAATEDNPKRLFCCSQTEMHLRRPQPWRRADIIPEGRLGALALANQSEWCGTEAVAPHRGRSLADLGDTA